MSKSRNRDDNTGRFAKSERPNPHCCREGCTKTSYGKGLCNQHWQEERRLGMASSSAPTCCVDGCTKPAVGKKMCFTHYQRVRRYGDPGFRKAAHSGENKTLRCLVGGCESPVVGRGYCSKHHQRLSAHGDPTVVLRLARCETEVERKQSKLNAQRRYKASPAGLLRARHTISKKRVLAGAHVMKHIPKDVFLALWSTTTCALCGGAMADADKSLDHIIPVSKGGDHSLANLQMAHLRCNQKKSNKVVHHAEVA